MAPFKFSIENTDEAISDLGHENIDSSYLSVFTETFTKALVDTRRCDSVKFIKGDIEKYLDVRELFLFGEDTVKFRIPKENVIVECDSVKPDYILFLSDLSTKDVIIKQHPADITDLGGWPGISHKSNYLFWDNVKGKIMAYGHVEAQELFALFVKRKTVWETCISSLASTIISKSPFKYRRKSDNYW